MGTTLTPGWWFLGAQRNIKEPRRQQVGETAASIQTLEAKRTQKDPSRPTRIPCYCKTEHFFALERYMLSNPE